MAFPFLTEKGGYDMIEEFEHYGKWSGGNDAHTDDRLKKYLNKCTLLLIFQMQLFYAYVTIY